MAFASCAVRSLVSMVASLVKDRLSLLGLSAEGLYFLAVISHFVNHGRIRGERNKKPARGRVAALKAVEAVTVEVGEPRGVVDDGGLTLGERHRQLPDGVE